MSWVMGISLYLSIWWTALFVVLPFGVRHNFTPDDGTATGAPVNTNMKRKFLANTVLSAVLWLVIYAFVKLDIIDFHAIARHMMQDDLGE